MGEPEKVGNTYINLPKAHQDSLTIGTPAKGGALKVYFDLMNLEETQKKIENFFKTRGWMVDKKLIPPL